MGIPLLLRDFQGTVGTVGNRFVVFHGLHRPSSSVWLSMGRRISSDDIVRVAIELAKEEYLANGDQSLLFELLEEIPK